MEWTALPKLHPKLASCMEGTDEKWLIIKQKPILFLWNQETLILVLNSAVFI